MTDLFNQFTSQLNFLLLAQRNIVLVSAFALALAQFKKSFDYPFINYLVLFLFSYAIAVGFKSVLDFNAYVNDTLEESSLYEIERSLVHRNNDWVYFTYALIAVVIFILLTYVKVEFFGPIHSALGLKTKSKKIN